eukprot:Skav208822  [mRNA]  locus=scaffold667:186295:199814:+ [translate_table: standard]
MAGQAADQAVEGEPGSPSAAAQSTLNLDGLAEAWEDDKTIRNVVLHKGSLCSWPNVASTGVITFDTMKMNAKLEDPIVQSLFDFVSEHWPVVKKGSVQSLEDGESEGNGRKDQGEDAEGAGSVTLNDDADLNGEEMAQLILSQESLADTLQDPWAAFESPVQSQVADHDSYQLMAEPVVPARDSQIPSDTYVEAEDHQPVQVLVEGMSPSKDISEVPAGADETHLDDSHKELETLLDSQASSPITPTVMEATPSDAPPPLPKPDKKEVEVVEVSEKRLSVQQCARPLSSHADGGNGNDETLPYEATLAQEELKRQPSPIRFIPDAEVKRFGPKVRPEKEAGEEPSSEKNPNAESLDERVSLFHAEEKVSRASQMEEADRLRAEKKKTKEEKEKEAEEKKQEKAKNPGKQQEGKAPSDETTSQHAKEHGPALVPEEHLNEEKKEEEGKGDEEEEGEETGDAKESKKPEPKAKAKAKAKAKVKAEGKAKAKAKAKAEGKAKAKAKAKAGSSKSTEKTKDASTEDGKDNAEESKTKRKQNSDQATTPQKRRRPRNGEGKATFARRARPANEASAQRWEAIRYVFNTKVAIKFGRPPSMEATAVSVKRCVNASEGKPASSDPATDAWHAERDFQRKFERMGLSLPIPVHKIEHEVELPDVIQLTSYHIKPRDWIKHWLNTCPQVVGGCHGDWRSNCEAFWNLYKYHHGNHCVYSTHEGNLSKVIPICLHGDEGRSVKKTNYLVVSIEPVFGSQNDPRVHEGCSCEAFLASRPDLPSYNPDSNTVDFDNEFAEIARKQQTNMKGHTFLSRWLMFGLGGWVNKRHPQVAKTILKALADDLAALFHEGLVLDSGERVYIGLVGIKGDMDFHAKYMCLLKSYSNLGRKSENQMCHLCEAGTGPYPFEDYREDPTWSAPSSMLAVRPWDNINVPALAEIPFDLNNPELALRGDLFHIVKLGVARDITGGTLILLLRKKFFDDEHSTTNIDDRFTRAHSSFALWCLAEGKRAGLRSFTKRFFNMTSLMSAAWCSSKASDSILLLQWLVWFLKLNLQFPTVVGFEATLRDMLELCESTLALNMVYNHGLFWERSCATAFYIHCMTMLRAYSVLGNTALRLKIRAYIQKPKHHALHHVAFWVKQQLKTSTPLVLSPATFNCDMNEDYVGRVARLSRRVSIRLCDMRVAQRIFLKTAALLKRRYQQAATPALSKPKPKIRIQLKRKRG